jgi:glycosyltransferase involved in cell wall biosynthesis
VTAAAPLLVVCDFNAHGGTQTQVLELLAAIDRDSWSPRLCTLNLDVDLAGRVAALDVPVINLALRGALRLRTIGALSDLAGFVRSNGVKLVHAFLMQGNLLGAVAARRSGIPYLTSVRNLDLRKKPHEILASRWAHAGASAVTFNSRHVLDLVTQREGIPRARARLIHNGIAPPEAPPAGDRALSAWPVSSTPRLLCAASLYPKKGHRYLLEAFALVKSEFPAAALVLAGQGPEREALEARVQEMGLRSSVVFAGYRDDARALVAGSDLLLLSSIEEGMPNVLLEAMAAGVPQVATSIGGTPEVIDEGFTGFLVPPRDPLLMAQRILRILGDGALRRRMSIAARERFAARFGRDRMAREHEALYAEVLGRRA